MIRAVIVEDEGVAARRLQQMLKKVNVEVVTYLKSNRELNHFIENEELPDLFFLDIHLNDGIVFETLQSYKFETPIIFTTAYDEYAVKAFKQNSVDYLLKPIDQGELKDAIDKYKDVYQKTQRIDYSAISRLLASSREDYRERIRIRLGNHLRTIKLKEVKLVYSESKITFILLGSGRSYPIESTVEKLTSELDPSMFFRVNRSQVVNIDFIQDVITYSNSRLKVVIENDKNREIIVARERVKSFKEWLG